MALGLNEGMTRSDFADIRFAERVERALGRPLTSDEAQWDIWEIRDGTGYNAEEVAEELRACAA
jgi:hypothetical protein